MGKPTIHFAYTVPLPSSFFHRALNRVLRILHITPLHRFAHDLLIPWRKPIRAPHSISYHLLHAFRERGYPVRFYNMTEKVCAHLKQGDIFIGQPVPEGGFTASRPSTDDKFSIASQTIRTYPHGNTFLIMPYTHDPLYVSWVRDLVRQPMKGLILVGGDIWQRNWGNQSPFSRLPIAPRTNVIMGIDTHDYPLVKKSFNPPGQRKYLYIGHTGWYKNTRQLEEIADAFPHFEGGHIGLGSIRGWKKIVDFADLTPEFMSRVAEEYDIFVNVSTADAQATTILEQMCFGFVVAATKESGYEHPSLIQLSTTDTAFNVKTLLSLQSVPESELLARARENRLVAEQKHSWNQFCNTVVNFMGI